MYRDDNIGERKCALYERWNRRPRRWRLYLWLIKTRENMKNTMKIMLALIFGASTIISCNKEIPFEENSAKPQAEKILTFTAGTEGDETKTSIDGFKVKWSASDAISILDGTHAGKYVLETGEGTTSGTFMFGNEGEAATEQTVYAVYPYAPSAEITVTWQDLINYLVENFEMDAEDAEWTLTELLMIDQKKEDYEEDPVTNEPLIIESLEEESLPKELFDLCMVYIKGGHSVVGPALNGNVISNLKIPNMQTVAAGQSVDPDAMQMVGMSTDGQNISFRNACAYVKVTLTEPCLMVTVTARGNEPIAGDIAVDMSNFANPSITCNSGSSVVTLKAAEGNLEAGTYYIAVAPTAVGYGMSVKFFNPETGHFKASISEGAKTLLRNKVYDAGSNVTAAVEGALIDANFSSGCGWPTIRIEANIPASQKPEEDYSARIYYIGIQGSVWAYYDGTNKVLYIRTTAPQIFVPDGCQMFKFNSGVKEYFGMENVNVSEVSNFRGFFQVEHSYYENTGVIDLSSWNFTCIRDVSYMFDGYGKIDKIIFPESFKFQSFTKFDSIFWDLGKDRTDGKKTVIKGITDEATRNAIMTDENWDPDHMMFE